MTDETTTESVEIPKMTIEQIWTQAHDMLVTEYVDFNGEPDPDVETWLGDAFESWLPSLHAVVLRDYTGGEVTAHAGARIVYDVAGLEAFVVYHA